VVNRTGLEGFYDIDLRWTPDAIQAPADDAPPTLATALREQLGLRLEPATLPMDQLVIDAVERPTEN
jgi:bla regulator protein BlaR1